MNLFGWRVFIAISLVFAVPALAQQIKPTGLRGNIEDRADELTERLSVYAKVNAAIRVRDFGALSTMAEDYRVNRSRSPSGTWKLAFFYQGFAEAFPAKQENGGCANPLETFVNDWIGFDPKQPAPYIVEAASYLNHALCLRGGAYANNIPPSVLARVAELSQTARKVLRENRDVASADPQFYAQSIAVNRLAGRGRDDLWEILDAAAAQEPYYYSTYFEASVTLLPRWYGQQGELERLGRFAIDKTRKVDGAGVYARLFWILDSYQEPTRAALDWELVKQGMRDVIRLYPNDWNTVNFAYQACQMADFAAVKALLDISNTYPIPQEWQLGGQVWDACIKWYSAKPR